MPSLVILFVANLVRTHALSGNLIRVLGDEKIEFVGEVSSTRLLSDQHRTRSAGAEQCETFCMRLCLS
jgi:hypothetical protein